nr:unnamed protein product [Digitaria exilis]
MSSSSSVETHARAFADEVRGGLDTKNWVLALGHPLLNRIAESFVKAAGVSTPRWLTGSVHSVLDQSPISFPCPVSSQARFHCFCRGSAQSRRSRGSQGDVLHGNRSAVCCVDWFQAREDQCPAPLARGLAAGVHSGLTYGLTEVRETHNWRNSAVASGITGCAIAGAALSTAANVLSGIF